MAGRHTGGSSVAGTTVYGGDDVPTRNFSFKGDSKGKGLAINGGAATEEEDHSDVALSQNYLSVNRPFFVPVDEKTGLLEAFRSLDQQLKNAGRSTILSKKTPKTWIGRTVEPGQCGSYSHGGLPKLLLSPGRYPGFPFGNWFARTWQGVTPLSSTVFNSNGLIAVQVSQNQAAVISDPTNSVFVLKNSGFVALSIEGSYRVLGVVDQTHLKEVIVDPLAGGKETRVLGYREDVKMSAGVGNARQEFVVATFLDIPANNCVILQKGDDLIQLPAGQHCITNPNITVRGWFSKGESQLELPSRDMYTKDQVPVELRVYLRWQLMEPLKLCTHGYDTPFAALKDKTLSVLTQIVSHLEYSSMVKQRGFQPGDDATDGPDTTSQAFLDALRSQAMDELHESALEYGIILRDLAVIDRKFKGDIAKTMDALTTRALQAQVEAANVERENSNRVKKEQGSLQVAKVQAMQRQTEADSQAYMLITRAKAEAEGIKIAAEAQAEAVLITARADAEAILKRSRADQEVKDQHARAMQNARIEVQRIGAYGDKTIFINEGAMSQGVTSGFGLSKGALIAQSDVSKE